MIFEEVENTDFGKLYFKEKLKTVSLDYNEKDENDCILFTFRFEQKKNVTLKNFKKMLLYFFSYYKI